MILIADSGSTKTTWAVVGTEDKVVTEGLNPHFITDATLIAACSTVRQHFQLSTFNFQLFFYGSGCGDALQRERVLRLLQHGFGTEDVHVETDMLGACRATWGRRNGLVGILGTGSNACYYDGERIVYQAPSLGYILGDHGSANHVGRLLLLDHLTGKMPDELSAMFHERYPRTHEEWIEALYHRPNPNRMLAALAPFAVDHLDDDYCRNTIFYALDDWYSYQLADIVLQSDCRRLCVVGGFAAAVAGVLDDYCDDNGITLGTVVANPMEGLLNYHAQYNI